jgi:Cys-rich protein (TIGR01571 family)
VLTVFVAVLLYACNLRELTQFAVSSSGLVKIHLVPPTFVLDLLLLQDVLILVQGSDVWSSSIFGVCADGCATCVISSAWPCVQHGRNAQRYALKSDSQASHVLPEAAVFCLVGLGATAAGTVAASFFPSLAYFTGCLPFNALAAITQVPLRRKVRAMYGISESNSCFGSDFLTASCCLCCSLIQVSHQLRKEPLNHRR